MFGTENEQFPSGPSVACARVIVLPVGSTDNWPPQVAVAPPMLPVIVDTNPSGRGSVKPIVERIAPCA